MRVRESSQCYSVVHYIIYIEACEKHTHTQAQCYVLVPYRHVEDIVPTIKLHYNKTRNDFDFLRVYYAYIYYYYICVYLRIPIPIYIYDICSKLTHVYVYIATGQHDI